MVIPAGQQEAAAFLEELTGGGVTETHISAVFLGLDEALKLKKAVNLGFLDFTRLEERERLVKFEHELNAPHAPGLYLGWEKLTRGAEGLRLGGEGEAVDWVLRMKRLPADAFLSERPCEPELLDPMADAVVALHASAPRREGDGDMTRALTGNREAGLSAGLPRAEVLRWAEAALALHERLKPWLAERASRGFLRRCHGDLHLGNLCLIDGRPTPFDALEFDEALATIDTGYDLAFLVMDLALRHGRGPANRVLNRYLACTGDVALLRGLPLWLSLRAFIRAHVTARSGGDPARLLAAALEWLEPAPRPVLIAIGGLPGTGKSTIGRLVAPELGPSPGAIQLRSDEIRKRLHGVPPEARLPKSAYGPGTGPRVFAELRELADVALSAGCSVVADGAYLVPHEREAIAAASPDFFGFWLEAPLDTLRARVASRAGDASDADVAVVDMLAAREAGPLDWKRVDATSDPGTVARKMLDSLPSAPP
jgi:aminoglycoside phosphotransferase family enzyme/predicted kinase